PAQALLVATHLALCPHCRGVVDRLDTVGSALFLGADPRAGRPPLGFDTDAALAAMLGRLDEPAPPEPIRAMPPAAGPGDIPMPLRELTGPLASVPFRRAAPGVWRFDLPLTRADRPVCLVSLAPGLAVPDHKHSAEERGLVLTGGFTDETGHYLRGDVTWRSAEETEPHRQRIDDGERCVVLMVDDGPKIPTTAVGKFVNFLFRI
ncbi:MAG: cupin domain-containing protein, partial [Myxococcota bacterium]